MRINRMGCTRIVFILKTVVIKVPNPLVEWSHFLRGLLGNMGEDRTYRWNSGKYEKGHSHLLCPVVWASWGGWILIMKRATMLTIEDFDTCDMKEHIKYFEGDDTMANYGFYEGRLVKVDYGDLLFTFGSDFAPQKL